MKHSYVFDYHITLDGPFSLPYYGSCVTGTWHLCGTRLVSNYFEVVNFHGRYRQLLQKVNAKCITRIIEMKTLGITASEKCLMPVMY